MTAQVIPFPGVRHDQEGRQPRARRFPHSEQESLRMWGPEVSFDAWRWVWRTGVKGTKQHVLLGLAHFHRQETGRCNPSNAELVEETGIGERTVRRMIGELIDDGVITAKNPGANGRPKGGRRTRPSYILIGLKTLPQRQGFEASEGADTRPQRPPSEPETRPERPPSTAETLPNLHEKPATVAPLVLRTKPGDKPGTTSAADAPLTPEPAADGGLFEVEPEQPSADLVVVGSTKPAKRRRSAIEERGYPSANPAIEAWTEAYAETHDAHPTDQRVGQVRRECHQLLKAGNDLAKVVFASRSSGRKGKARVNDEFDYLAANPGARAALLAQQRPATSDLRFEGALALSRMYEEQGE